MGAAGRGKTIAKYSMDSFGYCDQAHTGKTCLSDFRHAKHAIRDSSTGLRAVCSSKYSKRWPRTCDGEADWIWRNPLLTAPLWGPKRGLRRGQNKRGKGTKLIAVADGAGIADAVDATPASPHEVTLVETTLAPRFVKKCHERLIGDCASSRQSHQKRNPGRTSLA